MSEAAALGVEDADFGQRLRAFVVLEEGREASEDELKAHVKQNRALQGAARDLVPRRAAAQRYGKVLKRELRELDEPGGSRERRERGVTPVFSG